MTAMLWVILVMVALNVAMVVLTLGLKAVRIVNRRGLEARSARFEAALDDLLLTGNTGPALLRPDKRDMDLLATKMIEYLSLLSGEQRERLVDLAGEAGLVRRFFWRLGSRNRWRKAQAAESLGYFGGPEAVPHVTKLLSYDDETVRAVAARALARIGTPEAAAGLARTLNDPSELTRLHMAENLERLGPTATDPLVETLRTGNPAARTLAARVLGNLRAAEARPALREVLAGSSEAEVLTDLRAQATLALGRIGNLDDVPALLRAAASEDWPVRAQAANALETIGDTSTIPALQRLTVDPEWWVRLNGSRALANMGPAGERALVHVLEGEDRFARNRAAGSLEERGITRRAAEALAQPGQRGENARRMVRAMARAGAVRYLARLTEVMPEGESRRELERILKRGGAERFPESPPDRRTGDNSALPSEIRPPAKAGEKDGGEAPFPARPSRTPPVPARPDKGSGGFPVVGGGPPAKPRRSAASRDRLEESVRRAKELDERLEQRIAEAGCLQRRAEEDVSRLRELLTRMEP